MILSQEVSLIRNGGIQGLAHHSQVQDEKTPAEETKKDTAFYFLSSLSFGVFITFQGDQRKFRIIVHWLGSASIPLFKAMQTPGASPIPMRSLFFHDTYQMIWWTVVIKSLYILTLITFVFTQNGSTCITYSYTYWEDFLSPSHPLKATSWIWLYCSHH